MSLQTHIERLEQLRDSRVLVFGSSQLDIDMLPALYDAMTRLGGGRNLDVVFYSRGGVVNAARRIALLFREFSERVSFLVPHYCESAGTVTALSADEILAGPLAIFSPIDPLLAAAPGGGEGGPLAMSAQDLRLFSQMSVDWFGVDEKDAKQRALSVLTDNIFPSTLTSFYRATQEMGDICSELLGLHMGDELAILRCGIAEKLIFGYHSHTYALTRDDLRKLGLPVTHQPELEPLLWSIAQELRGCIGPGTRESLEDEWLDALVATRHGASVRRRSDDFPGRWQEFELA